MPVVKVYLRRDYTLFVVKINLYDNVMQLNFNDQMPVVLRVDLHILVAIGVYHHPSFAECIVERVVSMAMYPEIRAMIYDLVG